MLISGRRNCESKRKEHLRIAEIMIHGEFSLTLRLNSGQQTEAFTFPWLVGLSLESFLDWLNPTKNWYIL